MTNLQGNRIPHRAFRGLFKWPLGAWLVLVGGLLLGRTAFSQTTVSRDLSQYGLVITAPDTLLMAGETAVLSISTSTAITDATEIAVALNLGANTVKSGIRAVDVSDSWCYTETPSQGVTRQVLRVTGQCDPAISGSGELFQITLEAAGDSVAAARLIDGGGGHVLIITEDSGFKRVPESITTSGLRLFPQPFNEQISFDGVGSLSSLALYGLDGRLIRQAPPEVLVQRTWNLANLEAGLYLAVWTGADARGHARIEKR